MDGSNPRKSDAAATRKRRSSILKSQRSVRAPLSELEFNVATPPDQAKSRRVSFSRRTGVAEFEINEATTAWKNVYEEHNKSLESSANESGMKAAPRRVAHLGGRASHFTDDEADAVDARAELSALAPRHTVQLFRLDADPALRDLTEDLRIDFSDVAPLDDLDALQQDLDLQRDTCPTDVSEYSIDVDFNSTHITLKADDDDMSITETIRSPTVAATEAKSQVDWTADKENIIVNPYIAPNASDNFAVSDDCEDVLVFDGKKCKFQSSLDLSDEERLSRSVVYDTVAGDMSVTQAVARVALPARDGVGQKTVLLDDDMTVTGIVPGQILSSDLGDDRKPSRTIVYDDAAADISVTQAVARVVLQARDEVIPRACDQKTVYLDDDMAVTRAVPAPILQSEGPGDDGRKSSRTIVYDDAAADMSVTQAVALPAHDVVIARSLIDRKTIFDMAITRTLPAQILPSEDGQEERVSDPHATRRRTVVFGNDDGDISVTQAVHTNIINVESLEIKQPEPNRQGVTYFEDIGDMSVTQAVPADLIPEPRRKTIVFEDDNGHISVTEAVPAGALLAAERRDSVVPGLDNRPRNKEHRRTILYNNEDADISFTGVVMADEASKVTEPENVDHRVIIDGAETNKHSPVKEGSRIYSYIDANISKTREVPSNIINTESSEIIQPDPKQRTMYFEDIGDMSITQAVPADLIPEPRRKTIVFEDDNGHISVTEAVPAGALLAAERRDSVVPGLDHRPGNKEHRRTILYNNEDADISFTGVVMADEASKVTEPENVDHRVTIDGAETNKHSPVKEGSQIYSHIDANISKTLEVPSNIINTESSEIKLRTMYLEDVADMSVTQAVPADLVQEPPRRKTIVFKDDDGNISMTEARPADALLTAGRRDGTTPELGNKPENTERRRTIAYNEVANISITGVVMASIHVPNLTEPNNRSPEKEVSDSMRPQISPVMSSYTPNASFDAMSDSPKRDSLVGRPNASECASILDALLDMSQASMEALAIEYIPEAAPQTTASNATLTNIVPASNTSITTSASEKEETFKKDDEIMEIVSGPASMEGIPERPALEGSLPLPIEYKKDKHGIVCKLQHKLCELKHLLHVKERTSPRNSNSKSITYPKYTEDEKKSSLNTSIAPDSPVAENPSQMNDSDLKPASPQHDGIAERENKTLTVNVSSRISTHDKASSPERENNELTGSDQECDEQECKEQSQWTGRADDTRAILDALSDLADTRRSGQFEPAPSSPARGAPDRKSMVMSREELLREISMAQAVMKTEMQQTEELANSSDEQASPPRRSSEVVKTLRFEDDESMLEPRLLHKPAAAEAAPRRASAVIPTYDLSDHVKELVHDLIKPMADVVPQRPPDLVRAEPSRGSQVDNLSSSQIDLVPSSPVLIEPRRASCLRSPEPVTRHSEMLVEYKSPSPRRPGGTEAVIVFDHLNPLNNILLPPPDESIVHKYNPRRSRESLSPSLDSRAVQTVERVPRRSQESLSPSSDSQAVQTAARVPQSRSVACGMVLVGCPRGVRDAGANTSIVMKGNRELLAASSSLTLVDDGVAEPGPRPPPRSPVQVIFQLDEPCSSVKLDSDLTSCDDSSECKRPKRGHTKGLEVTPKPAIKVQKVCNSPVGARRRRSRSPSEGSASGAASSLTVGAAWSCSRSSVSRADWKPELLHEPSSKNLACEEDPGVNVVAKIDVLPFMGTSECEWESRAADTWSFRLLCARLRLLVRLEHRACNTTRSAVRADTPVRLVLVQHARDSESDPVAALCLCLTAEALQRVAARGCARAGAVPALLRRCAAVARVALRWGRAMRAARRELAFSLADDGRLSLKVANIPLRSVWEVRLRVELAGAAWPPWPRAAAPRVAPVVAAWTPADHELRALLDAVPEDWGHVPRTVWKIFKYLKNKRLEDDLLTA